MVGDRHVRRKWSVWLICACSCGLSVATAGVLMWRSAHRRAASYSAVASDTFGGPDTLLFWSTLVPQLRRPDLLDSFTAPWKREPSGHARQCGVNPSHLRVCRECVEVQRPAVKGLLIFTVHCYGGFRICRLYRDCPASHPRGRRAPGVASTRAGEGRIPTSSASLADASAGPLIPRTKRLAAIPERSASAAARIREMCAQLDTLNRRRAAIELELRDWNATSVLGAAPTGLSLADERSTTGISKLNGRAPS